MASSKMEALTMLVFYSLLSSYSARALTITAEIGENVTLPCNAEGLMPLEVVEWSRPAKELEYVLIFYYEDSNPDIPEDIYKRRVELKNAKEGDVSLVLKTIRKEDNGTYDCYVKKRGNRRKRDIQLVSTINLHVLPQGRRRTGLIVGLVGLAQIFAQIIAVSVIWRKKRLSAFLPDSAEKPPSLSRSNPAIRTDHAEPTPVPSPKK